MDPTRRRVLVVHSTVALLLAVAAVALYVMSLRDLRRLQPTYPNLIVVTVATPPHVFVSAHLLFPIALTIGTIAIGGAAVYVARAGKPRRNLQLMLFALHSLVMLAFIGVFVWAAVWCQRVFALLGTPP